jgi:Bacterial TSP3 repeat
VVYQILQNRGPDTGIGSEEFQLTTIAGSTDAIGACSGNPGENLDAEAVVAAATGRAFPLDGTVRSGMIERADPPCFNPNAEGGRGRVCIGSGCTSDCICLAALDCFAFTTGDGVPVTSDADGVTALGLVDPLTVSGARCAGFSGGATYSFGSGGPTTSAPACTPVPTDGLRLPATPSTIILVYASPLTVPFALGSAGFAIDTDGANVEGCDGGVITGIATNQNKIPPPRFDYTAFAGVTFDFNGDSITDKVLPSCLNATLSQCGPPTTPTPTPTVGPPPPCAPEILPSQPVVTVMGVTTGTANALGGATCGDGGNSAPERVFEFTAPSVGVYVIETDEADFDTLLYIRAGACDGPELACSDDTFDSQLSLVALNLSQGQTVAIVVDGSAGASGSFTLRVRNTDSDGDGFSDQDEARAGSDPFDVESVPPVSSESDAVSYLNQVDRPSGNGASNAVSYLNTFRRPPGRAESAPVAYLNRFFSSTLRSAYSGIVSYLKQSTEALWSSVRRHVQSDARQLIAGGHALNPALAGATATPTSTPTPMEQVTISAPTSYEINSGVE